MPSPEMIAVARQKAAQAGLSIDFQVAPIEALPFPNATLDVVLSSLMMHRLPDDLKAVGLAEVRRVLKPGGRLLIVDFTHPRGWLSRLAMRILLHGRLARGFQNLPGILAAAGFAT